MKPWTIGLSTGCFYSRPIFEVLDGIRESGFEAIEVCSFPAHLDYHNHEDVARAGERMRTLGLLPVSFHAPFAEKIDITALDPGARAVAVHELVVACEAAAVMGVKNMVLHPGPERSGRPPEAEFLDRMRNAAETLNTVAERCGKLGVHLLLENMLPHLLFGHINDMLYLLGSIRTCDVGACLDTGHAFLARELGTVIHKLSGHLHLVHVNDNRGDRDEHLAPGEGHIDWPCFIRELKRSNFSGTLILELSLRDQESVSGMLERARHARDYLTELMLNPD
ncbi:MAG: sugar phosphate isomerase/epimerase family protein [Luteolibacter sp.]